MNLTLISLFSRMHGMAGLFHFSGWIRVSNCIMFSIVPFMLRIITEYFYYPFMKVELCIA